MRRVVVEVRYEWVREYTVVADYDSDAEVQAALLAKEALAEQFEEGTPSMEEFDIEVVT
jgi:hypothetical protein